MNVAQPTVCRQEQLVGRYVVGRGAGVGNANPASAIGTANFVGSGTSFSTAITSGAAAILQVVKAHGFALGVPEAAYLAKGRRREGESPSASSSMLSRQAKEWS